MMQEQISDQIRQAFAKVGIGVLETLDAALESGPLPADPNDEVPARIGYSRMRLSRAAFRAKLKAQDARDNRGEVTVGARVPKAHEKNGGRYFYEGEITAYESHIRNRATKTED